MSNFEPDPAALRQLANSPEMSTFLLNRAEAGAQVARDLAPTGGADDPHPNQFRESIGADVGVDAQGRLVGRITSDDEDFIPIEFGTSHSPPHATLRRAADAIGVDLQGDTA